MKIILKGLIFLILSVKVTAGDFCIAPQFGYCKSASLQLLADSYQPELFHLFRNNHDFVMLRTGVTLSYGGKWFSYTSGLTYSRLIIDHAFYGRFLDLNIVQLPIGFNLHVGKKLYGYLSIGVYLNYQNPKQPESEERFSRFQPGITSGIGAGYHFCSSIAMEIVYRAEDGFLPMYYEWLSTSAGPWGHAYWQEEYVPVRSLTLNLAYTIPRKNNECKRRH
jgi:hypothetical protein